MGRRHNGHRFREFGLVEPGVENVLDAFVKADAGRPGPGAGGLEALRAVALGQSEEAQAGTVGLLRMDPRGQECLDDLSRLVPNRLGPTGEAFWRPLLVGAMRRGHVFGQCGVLPGAIDAGVHRDATVAKEDFHRTLGNPQVDFLVDESIGDAVVVVLELDIVVDVDTGLFPQGELVGLRRQRSEVGRSSSSKSSQRGRPRCFIGRALSSASNSRMAWFSSARPKKVRLRRRARIQRDYLYAHFDPGLVLGLARTRREHSDTVVLGHVLVAGIEVGFVAAGTFHPRLEVIGHHDFRHPAQEGKQTDVSADPVGQVLSPVGLGVGVVAGAQGGDEDLGSANLAGVGIDDGDGLSGVIERPSPLLCAPGAWSSAATWPSGGRAQNWL